MTPLAPAALLAVATALAVPPSAGTVLAGRVRQRGVRQPWGADRRRWIVGLLLVSGAAAVALVAQPAATTLPLTATALVAGGTGVLLFRRQRTATRARTRRSGVVEACDALAAGLRAGQSPHRVLDRVADDVDTLRPTAAAAHLGGDVAAALRSSASRLEGAEGLDLLAAAWTVAQRSGAGLADVVSAIAGTVRAEADRRRQVEVALGTSRSTARLLAGLPLMGIALGSGIDAHPLDVLFRSSLGAWCLLIGTALAAAGLVWVERLADGAVQ